jgi:acylphosphatase
MSDAGAAKRLHARVTGRVQGVGFRATTIDVARRVNLSGWVRNLFTGEVELEAEGKPEALEELVVFLHQGPPGARVDGVAVSWLEPIGLGRPFGMRRTE